MRVNNIPYETLLKRNCNFLHLVKNTTAYAFNIIISISIKKITWSAFVNDIIIFTIYSFCIIYLRSRSYNLVDFNCIMHEEKSGHLLKRRRNKPFIYIISVPISSELINYSNHWQYNKYQCVWYIDTHIVLYCMDVWTFKRLNMEHL